MTSTNYFHGTAAKLRPGDLIWPGREPNFIGSQPRRVYCTANPTWAAMYGALAEQTAHGRPWAVYQVMPLARHLHREPSGFWAMKDPDARWSGLPLRVVREVPFTTGLRTVVDAVARTLLSESRKS